MLLHVPESPSEITALRFQPAKLIVFQEMAFQSHFSSVKVAAALGKFNRRRGKSPACIFLSISSPFSKKIRNFAGVNAHASACGRDDDILESVIDALFLAI